MIGRAVRHLAPDRLRRVADGAGLRLDEVVHVLCCARCADALQRYERADVLAQEIARVTGTTRAAARPARRRGLWRWVRERLGRAGPTA